MPQTALKANRGDKDPGCFGLSDESSLIVKSIRIHERRTSVRLEPEMWNALDEVAAMEGLTIHGVCARVDDSRTPKGTFSSALRVYLLCYYRNAARCGEKARRAKVASHL